MLPFLGDILELGGALIIFPLNFGLVHHMYMKVRCTSKHNNIPPFKFQPTTFQNHYQNFGIKVVNMVF